MRGSRLIGILLLSALVLLCRPCRGQDWRSSDEYDEPYHPSEPFSCGTAQVQQEAKLFDLPGFTVHSAVSRAGASAEDRERDYRWMRIHVSTDDLDNPIKYCTGEGEMASDFQGGTNVCEAGDELTGEKKRILREGTYVDGQLKHQRHLMVRRSLIRFQNSACGQFAVPSSHSNPGYINVDYIAYCGVGKGDVYAWGGPCCFFQGRPGCGQIFMNTAAAQWGESNVMCHEAGHANSMGAGPYPIEVELRKNPYCVASNGKHARQQGNIQYNWSLNFGPEYEGREIDTGDIASEEPSFAHWLSRNCGGEYMGCFGPCNYGILGMGLQRDLEYYRVRYDRGVFSAMAYKQGEQHNKIQCAIEGVAQADNFCGIEDRDYCYFDRLEGYGECEIVVADVTLPEFYQYFTNPTLCGDTGIREEKCAYAVSDKNCKSSATWSMTGSVGGPDGACLNTNYTEEGSRLTVGGSEISALCVRLDCNLDDLTYNVLFYGESHFMPCPDREVLNMSKYTEEFTDGLLECPPYYFLCGRVDWNMKNAALPSALLRSARGLLVIGCIVVAAVLTLI